MKKILLLFTFLSLFSSTSHGQTPDYISAVNSTGANAIPLGSGTSWDNYRSQFLYPAGDFGSSVLPGLITAVYFKSATNQSATTTWANVVIAIGQNNISVLNTYETTGMDTVLNVATLSVPPTAADQWIKFELDKPVFFNPALPLIIDISQQGKVGGAGGYSLRAGSFHGFNDHVYGSLSSSGTARNYGYQFGIDILPKQGQNNGGINGASSTQASCPGSYPLTALVRNFGENQIDSIDVNWSIDGVLQPPVRYKSVLDTADGSGNAEALVVLGNHTFAANTDYILKVWTSDPNGVADTINLNDTLTTTISLGAPTGLSHASLTPTSAELNWDTIAFTDYDMIYGPSGFDPDTGGTVITSVSPLFYLSGLSPNTDYDFYIYADCGGGAYSDTSDPHTFTTLCAPVTTPYMVDFESYTVGATGPSIGQCVYSVNTSDPVWKINEGTTPSTSTGPAVDHTLGTPDGNYVFLETSGGSLGDTDTLYLEEVDISNLTVPYLSFWYHMYGSSMGDLRVELWNGTKWDTLGTLYGQQQDSQAEQWHNFGTDFSVDADTIQLRFLGIRGSDLYGDIALDDIEIRESPPCPAPAAVTLIGKTTSSATIGFTSGGSKFIYEYGLGGYGQGTGTIDTTGNPFTVTGLDPNTTYDIYISRDCDSNGTSSWVGPLTFTTLCIEAVMPYFEGFNTWPPSCVDSTGGSHYWAPYSGSGGNHAEANFWNVSSGDYHITTQAVIVDQPAQIRFDWSHQFNPSYPDEKLTVDVFSMVSGTWDTVLTLEGPDNFHDPTASNTAPGDFIEEIIYLDSSYVGDTIRVRFIAVSDFGPDLFIDSINVESIPPCPPPLKLVLDTLTNNSATVSFRAIGTETFEYEYGSAGYEQGTGTIGSGGNPLTATGMDEQTAYDLYIRSDCSGSGNGSSEWMGPITFVTGCDNPLNGIYTVDPGQSASATNFTSIADAVDAVNICGVSGPVTFNIKEGVYSEQMEFAGHPQLDVILGSGPDNPITFQSDPSNSSMPEITYSATSTEDNFVIKLTDASYITFKGLVLRATGATYARVVELSGGGNSHISFVGDSILTDPFSTSSNRTGIYSSGAKNDHITIQDNIFIGGYYPIYLYGSSSDVSKGLVIDNNEIRDWYYSSAYLGYVNEVQYTNNVVRTNSYSYYPIRLYYCEDSEVSYNDIDVTGTTTMYPMYIYYSDRTSVVGNKLNASTSGTNYGLRYYDNDNSSSQRGLVANNMISVNGAATTGIYVYSSDSTDIVYNSVNIASATGSSNGFEIGSSVGSNIIVLNNNLVNAAGGYAIYGTESGIDELDSLDYNNYYSLGGDMGYYGGAESNLEDWQTSTGRDAHSVSGNPVFPSPDNLHALGSATNNIGVPLPYITMDIDGDARSVTTPDIGADEFTPASADLDLIGGEFAKNLPCLSTADTLVLYIQNIIGDTVDFSVDPLTAHYTVTGPVNSSGSITLNTGMLSPWDTAAVMANNIDLSVPGLYTLEAYIDSNAVNTLWINDTLSGSAMIEIDTVFKVEPQSYTFERANDSLLIRAISPFFSGGGQFMITEICHFRGAVSGAPSGGWPSYLTADDYIEITGVPGSDLGGITLEQWSTTAMNGSYTFPQGTLLSPDGTAIIMVGESATSNDPANYVYDGRGSATTTYGSSTAAGRILKDASGNIIDAASYSGSSSYTFPTAAGVTPADWSGNPPTSTSTAGIRLEGVDDNTSANWVVSTTSSQDPHTLNTGVVLPTPEGGQPGFTWSLNGTVVDSVPAIYVGPFTNPGDYKYVATYVSPCGITYTDTVVVTAPSCPLPFGLSVSGINSNSAVLSWTSSNNATSWTVIYDTTGFDPSAGGNTVVANSNPYTLTGLTPNYVYDYYIISDCGSADGISDTAGPVSFRTPCTPVAAPYLEDFESFTVGYYDGEEACWIVQSNNPGTDPDDGFSWEIRDTVQTSSTGTGPAGDHTLFPGTGGHYFHSDNSSGSVGDSTILISPLVDVSTLNNPELEFYVHYFSSPTSSFNQSLRVDVYDGNTWTKDIYVLTSPLHSSSTDPWDSVIINLVPFSANGRVQVRFRGFTGSSVGGAGDISIDDVNFHEGPTCPAPLNFEMISSTSNSATLSWVPGSSSAVGYEIEYDTVGFVPGTGNQLTSATSSITVPSLPTNIPYEAYLMMDCGSGDQSSQIGPVIFGALSLCDDLEGYSAGSVENQSMLFEGWYGDGVDGIFSTTRALSGTNSLRIYDTGPGGASDVVAAFDPITSGIWEVSFSMYVESGHGAYFNIQQNYTPSGTNLWGADVYFDNTGTATVEYGDPAVTVGTFSYTQAQWETITTIIDLDNDTIWIELNGTSTGIGWQYSLANSGAPLQFNGINFYSGVLSSATYDIDYYMDDFCVSDATPCAAPTALGAINITSNSAEVHWVTGGAAAWNVEYGLENFVQGGGTMVPAANDTLILKGLVSDTCYDFYVQDNCGADSSSWTGPYTFCTDEAGTPCGKAGADSSSNVCDTIIVDLNNYLSGADAGGSWIDMDSTGALTGSMFDASAGVVSYGSTYDFYYIIAASADCPGDTAIVSITVDSCTVGLKESILSRKLAVYPNPTSGDVYVEFSIESSEDAEISIMDLSGKVIYRNSISDIKGHYTDRISMRKMAKGVYLLKVEVNPGVSGGGSLKAIKRIIRN